MPQLKKKSVASEKSYLLSCVNLVLHRREKNKQNRSNIPPPKKKQTENSALIAVLMLLPVFCKRHCSSDAKEDDFNTL